MTEIEQLERDIKRLDDEIEDLENELSSKEARRDELESRHAILSKELEERAELGDEQYEALKAREIAEERDYERTWERITSRLGKHPESLRDFKWWEVPLYAPF